MTQTDRHDALYLTTITALIYLAGLAARWAWGLVL